MNKLMAVLSIAGLGLGASVIGVAEDVPYEENHWLLAKYDLNGDARITTDEIASKKLNIFRVMDDDRNGGVSFDEYKNVDDIKRQSLLKARFSKLDRNNDGKVSETEYSSYLGLFASIDSNGDGALTSDEMVEKKPVSSYDTRCVMWFCLRTARSN